MKILALIFAGALCAVQFLPKAESEPTNGQTLVITNSLTLNGTNWPTTNFMELVIHNDPGTNFLTLSNHTWVSFGGCAIIRVTDAEWEQITNAYPDKLTTDPLYLYR